MTMTTEVARLRIARKIQATGVALDQALTVHSELFATMIEAGPETGSGTAHGHDTLLRLAKVQQALLEADGDLARVHGQLLEISVEKGQVDDCPPSANAQDAAGNSVLRARAA